MRKKQNRQQSPKASHKGSIRKFTNKKIIVSAVIILLVAAIVSAGLWWWGSRDEMSEADINQQLESQNFVLERSEAQQRADDLSSAVIIDGTEETLAESTQELERQIELTDSAEEKAIYLSELISVYRWWEDYDTALEYAKKLEELERSHLSAGLMAGVYQDSEEFAEAARYYQIAADRSEPANSPQEDVPYNNYMILKKEVEAEL